VKTIIDVAAAEVARTLSAMDAAETAHYRALEALDIATTLRDPRGIAKARRAERVVHRAMWNARRAHWAARDAEFLAQRALAAALDEESQHVEHVPHHGANDTPEVGHG
jgi:hypothetical protein